MLRHHLMRTCGPRVTSIVVTVDTSNVNLFALAGSPGAVANVNCEIVAGVKIGSTSASTPAFRTGGFAAGSTIRVVNRGRIAGKGGDGGDGKDGSGAVGAHGDNGSNGGIAVQLDDDVTWDNTDTGNVYGGGGGGGGGGAEDDSSDGGGGGGGQGINNSQGGTGPGPATGGDDGTEATRGAGGVGNGGGGRGGGGGSWGSSGSNGSNGNGTGGNGGSGGKAVALNGKSITWLAGNNSTQVRGAVA